ncbi:MULTISPECIES: hypothetical protein [Acinetobacter]|uniref:Uncharacterized protein n=2 Tax=Acinetobacter TaxID=469 RepID=A0A4Q7B687_9GAMM|nr:MULTISPECIES: hypothetical protein [Acinetobacter]MCW8037694.1 hypothetical protein [Acinetobacter entericus]RZG68792.1 hypothetical protein EXE25_03710 [Acinetobacter bouvetii]TCB75744.1 hypothetical protein E0H91_04945 [Acinetobacter sp. ANC 4177]
MLIKSLDNYKISLYEFLTLVFFIGISYAYLNKIILYEALGISWLIGSLTPNYVLVSSLGFIFSTFVGASIGLLLPMKRLFFITMIVLGFVFSGLYSLINYFDFLSVHLDKNFNFLALIFWCLVCMFCFGITKFNIEMHRLTKSMGGKPVPLAISISLFIILVLGTPSWLSKIEQKKIFEKPEIFYSQVSIKNDTRKWFLLEFIGDKALIKLAGNDLIYKYVEYKDIELYEAKSR